MLTNKNPVLTGFHPDPNRLLCAKGDSPTRGNVAKRQKGCCLGERGAEQTEGFKNYFFNLFTNASILVKASAKCLTE